MNIRKTTMEDADSVFAIYEYAREYMRQNGNPNQWEHNRPPKESILKDIENGDSYIIEEKGEIVGVFSLIIGEDPTYKVIENGEWHSDKTYGTIHKLASNGKASGVARACFEYCDKQIDYLRVDTHADNSPMRRVITSFGFVECGTIYVSNGARIAYDRERQKKS